MASVCPWHGVFENWESCDHNFVVETGMPRKVRTFVADCRMNAGLVISCGRDVSRVGACLHIGVICILWDWLSHRRGGHVVKWHQSRIIGRYRDRSRVVRVSWNHRHGRCIFGIDGWRCHMISIVCEQSSSRCSSS